MKLSCEVERERESEDKGGKMLGRTEKIIVSVVSEDTAAERKYNYLCW